MVSEKIVDGIVAIAVVGILALFRVSVMDHGYKFKVEGNDITLEHDNT